MDRTLSSKYARINDKSKRNLFIQKSSSGATLARRHSLPPTSPMKTKQKSSSTITQAISEALDDCTQEHLAQYDLYNKELSAAQVCVEPSTFDEKEPLPTKEETRRRSFDLQLTKSPVISSSPSEQPVDDFTLGCEKAAVPVVIETPTCMLLYGFSNG